LGLHTGLASLGLADHVILVGHSYAGFTLQLYAAMFTSGVDGLLFVDPNSPSFVLAMGGATAMVNQPGQHLSFDTAGQLTKVQAATVHQMRSFGNTVEEVAAAPLPPSIPVIVLTAGHQWWPVQRQNRAFRASHELLANSVDDGLLIVAQQSAHMIPETQPDLIVTCVKALLAKHPREPAKPRAHP
jgi:pimeloyl-ACP methyl ester carboxylesterase